MTEELTQEEKEVISTLREEKGLWAQFHLERKNGKIQRITIEKSKFFDSK